MLEYYDVSEPLNTIDVSHLFRASEPLNTIDVSHPFRHWIGPFEFIAWGYTRRIIQNSLIFVFFAFHFTNCEEYLCLRNELR